MSAAKPDKLEVLVASRDAEAVSVLQAALAESERFVVRTRTIVNGHADPMHGVNACPDALVIILSSSWAEELSALVERPPEQRPPLIAIAEAGDAAAMRMAMQAGARDFLIKPLDRQELSDALARVTAETRANLRPASSRDSKVLAMINAKGGAGASLLAANLACRMAAEGDAEVGLVDLDLQFGSLCSYLDLCPERGLRAALETAASLDEVGVGGFMARHESGVRLMASTEDQRVLQPPPAGAETTRLLDLLALRFQRVVVDVPRWLDASCAAALQRADRVGLVVQQSVSHVRDANRLKRLLVEELMIPEDRLALVINRHDRHCDVTGQDVEHALGMETSVRIPNDFKTVNACVNYGKSLVEYARRASITRSLEQLEAALLGEHKRKPTGVFGRTLGNLLRSQA